MTRVRFGSFVLGVSVWLGAVSGSRTAFKSVLKKGSDPLLREWRDSTKTWRILARSKGSDPFFNTL
jgi:hypothetical protein